MSGDDDESDVQEQYPVLQVSIGVCAFELLLAMDPAVGRQVYRVIWIEQVVVSSSEELLDDESKRVLLEFLI